MPSDKPGDPDCKCKGYGCCACMSAHPPGKTCKDCVWFERKCSWLLSYKGTETACDWIPSRYRQIEEAQDGAAQNTG